MPILLSRPQVEVGPGYLYSSDFQDCYFQQESPIAEINHVFIDGPELINFWDECEARQQAECIIGETGFGSGLNFIVTWQHWLEWCEQNPQSTLQLHFVSVEFAPLQVMDLRKIYQAFPTLHQFSSQLIDKWPPSWQGCHARQFSHRVFLSLLFGDAVDMLRQHNFSADIWFLDGFAPSRNQRMWSAELYQLLASHSKQHARIATFTAAGHVRRGLEDVGFQVRKQPGFHKREMSVGYFYAKGGDSKGSDSKVNRNYLHREARHFAIIGAGYAGLHAAQALQEQGIKIDLYDQAPGPMQGASANHAHLLYLNPRVVNNQFNYFFEQAYSFSIAAYQNMPGATPVEVLHVMQGKMAQWTDALVQGFWPEQWLRLVSAEQASDIAGLLMKSPCLWMPHGFVIQPQVFAQNLLQQAKGIHTLFGHRIVQLGESGDQGWLLASHTLSGEHLEKRYDGVVIAAGSGTISILNTLGNYCIGSDASKPSHWRYPLRPIAGQSSVLPSTQASLVKLKAALCGSVYLTPSIDGAVAFGSSFYPDQFETGISEHDHIENLEGLIELLDLNYASEHLLPYIATGFSGTRVQTTDYLPMVGSIFPEKGKNLYVVAGFGAKGSMVAPFAACLLRQLICGQAPGINQDMLNVVDPARFSRRLAKRYE